jgi:hypothetical protein
MVPERGLEPPLPCENQVLNLARLPVPPFGHGFDSTLFASLSATNASQRTISPLHLCTYSERDAPESEATDEATEHPGMQPEQAHSARAS